MRTGTVLMGHTFTNHLYHIVFSTKARQRHIKGPVKDRLLEYIGGIARRNKATILAINAAEDHVHMLARVQPDIAVSKFVGIVKANSSEWVPETCPEPSIARRTAGLIGFDNSVHGLTPVATCCRAARSDEKPSTRLHLI